MAAYSVEYSEEAVSVLSKLPHEDCSAIIKRIEKLQDNPERFVYSLTGTKLCSMRVGNYRVLVSLDRKERKVYIVTIGHRKKVYDRDL